MKSMHIGPSFNPPLTFHFSLLESFQPPIAFSDPNAFKFRILSDVEHLYEATEVNVLFFETHNNIIGCLYSFEKICPLMRECGCDEEETTEKVN